MSNTHEKDEPKPGNNLEPGTFREVGIEEDVYVQGPKLTPQQVDLSPDISTPDSSLGQAVALFVKEFGMPKRVLYPACGTHVIDQLFPDAEIVYVDPSETTAYAIRKGIGTRSMAITSGIEAYKSPDQFDLVFSLNSHAPMDQQLKDLRPGGLIFCNNYIGTRDAEKIICLGSCELLAVIIYQQIEGKESAPVLQTTDLEGYLAPVVSDDKLLGPRREKSAAYYLFSKRDIESIEKNKDKLDLKPAVDFVDQHLKLYQEGLETFLARGPSESGTKLAVNIAITGVEDIVEPQVLPEEARKIIEALPEGLVQASMLKEVGYHTFGQFVRKIPVPGYDQDGNFDSSKVQLVSVDEFPRPEDHPTRILVGVSNGTHIFPTPIPPTVSDNPEAIKMYQVHVFLHEFFHTLDYGRRDSKARAALCFEVDGNQFTFQQWWEDFEEMLLSGFEPQAISSYAETYLHQLNKKTKQIDEVKFTAAVAEQICETFVAYQLGLVSNNQGWTNFKTESFGNLEQLQKYLRAETPAANLKWVLMDKLCRAKVVLK